MVVVVAENQSAVPGRTRPTVSCTSAGVQGGKGRTIDGHDDDLRKHGFLCVLSGPKRHLAVLDRKRPPGVQRAQLNGKGALEAKQVTCLTYLQTLYILS